MAQKIKHRLDGKPLHTRYTPELKILVRKLLAEGRSSSSIARETGVNVGVVSKVRRGLYWLDDDEEVPTEALISSGKKGRCPACGRMVWLPCIACGVES